jgi:hypothetical protein
VSDTSTGDFNPHAAVDAGSPREGVPACPRTSCTSATPGELEAIGRARDLIDELDAALVAERARVEALTALVEVGRSAMQHALDRSWSSCSHYNGCNGLLGEARLIDKKCGHCRIIAALALLARAPDGLSTL